MNCSDLVKDIALLISGPNCFLLMCQLLESEMKNEPTWDRVEAILWSLSAIAPQVGSDCPAVVPLLQTILGQAVCCYRYYVRNLINADGKAYCPKRRK